MKIPTNKTCVFCGNKYYAKDMCKLHYCRTKKNRDVNMPVRRDNEYKYNGDFVEVTYYDIKHEVAGVFLVDEIMVDKIKQMKWSVMNTGYIASYKNGETILLHRFITDCPDGLVVDHINHDKKDNRLCNLRVCTQKENVLNSTQRPGKSGIVGITLSKKGYYSAYKNGKYLGCSKDLEIAKSYL